MAAMTIDVLYGELLEEQYHDVLVMLYLIELL